MPRAAVRPRLQAMSPLIPDNRNKTMLTAASFFDLSSWAHPDLIQAGAEPWAALKSLKGYLAARDYPEFPPGLVRDREPLRQTLVFYDNSFLEAEGLVLDCGDATKGGVKVYDGDRQLAGASVIMAVRFA